MIVVSDTSALIVLAKLNRLSVLPVLFGNVYIPPEVLDEFTGMATKYTAPGLVTNTTTWLHIQAPKVQTVYKGLHPGETAAIALAKELLADFLIIDEKAGRKIAAMEQVRIIGTIGILEKAADADLLDLAQTFAELKQMKFYLPHQLLDQRLKAFLMRQARVK